MSVFGNKPVKNQTTLVQDVKPSFTQQRNNLVIEALQQQGSYDLLKPTRQELSYVEGVYNSANFHNMNTISEDFASRFAEQEMKDMSTALSNFMRDMGLVTSDNASIAVLMDSLSKEANTKELEGIWQNAINAKPTLLAQMIGLFNSQYKKRSVINQVDKFSRIIDDKGQRIGNRIDNIEKDLISQQKAQKDHIRLLEGTFELYYNTFKKIREKFILINYIETNYRSQLDMFKKGDVSSIEAQKKLNQYERVLSLIENKRLLIHKSLMQIVFTVDNNDKLIKSCQNVLIDIDGILLHSLPNIKSNLITIAIALRTEKTLLENESITQFDNNQTILAKKVSSDLMVKTEELQGKKRLRDSEIMTELVAETKNLQERLKVAKENKQKDVDKATEMMNNASKELVKILSNKI